MKANKLFRKLALSGVALGAAAVTLTATTFAWYTSNTEADVTAVTGATEAKGSDSLFISTAATYKNDGSQEALTWNGYEAEADPVLTAGSAKITLKPVFSNFGTIKAATTEPAAEAVLGRAYNAMGSVTGASKDTVNYKDEAQSDFFEFVFRVRSAQPLQAAKPLYFSEFNITTEAQKTTGENPTSIPFTQIPLTYGSGTGIGTAAAYGADLMKALKLDVTSKEVTLQTGSAIPDAGVTTRAKGSSQTEQNNISTYGFETLAKFDDVNIGTGENAANAVGYYNKVMGTSIAAPNSGYNVGTETALATDTTNAGTTKISFASLPATTSGMDFSVIEVRFVLYLDGWDNYCYDVMQGQTVNFSFQVTTAENKAVLVNKKTS